MVDTEKVREDLNLRGSPGPIMVGKRILNELVDEIDRLRAATASELESERKLREALNQKAFDLEAELEKLKSTKRKGK